VERDVAGPCDLSCVGLLETIPHASWDKGANAKRLRPTIAKRLRPSVRGTLSSGARSVCVDSLREAIAWTIWGMVSNGCQQCQQGEERC